MSRQKNLFHFFTKGDKIVERSIEGSCRGKQSQKHHVPDSANQKNVVTEDLPDHDPTGEAQMSNVETDDTQSSGENFEKRDPVQNKRKVSDDQGAPVPSCSTSTRSTAKGSKNDELKNTPKRPKKFQSVWHKEFDWLSLDNEGRMRCTTCVAASGARRSLQSNAFVKGSFNYQRSALSRHLESDDHILARKTLAQQSHMSAAKKCATKSVRPILEAQMRTAAYLAEQTLPNRKFLSLIDLQIANGANVFKDKKGIYTSHQTPATMQKYLADALKDTSLIRIKNSPFIGLMVDESLDIATNKKLVMFCKIVNNGEMKMEFCANISVVDGKADTVYNSIINWLDENGLSVKQLSGFGSDGASVMMGRLNGVGVKLKSVNPKLIHIWCAAHRLALVSYWAAKGMPYFNTINEMLIAIYNFYQYSAPRYNKIKELQAILGSKVKRFKKPTQVRWLSLSEAVKACHDAYSALILGLEHEVANNPNTEGGNKARGILKNIKTFKFIATLSFLKDILQVLDNASKIFQKDTIDIDQLKTILTATKATLQTYENEYPPTMEDCVFQIDEYSEFKGVPLTCSLLDRRNLTNTKNEFIRNILRELNDRFPDDSMDILVDLNAIFNPRLLPRGQTDIQNYGLSNLQRCIDKYGAGDEPNINAENTKSLFLPFKHVVNVNRELKLQEFCALLIRDYKEAFPDYATLASILLTCPLTSVPCERGFSLQNRHHCATSSRRSIRNVEYRMRIEYECKQSSYDRDSVVQQATRNFINDRN